MRKILCLCLLLAVLASSALCVSAADSKVAFTSGSSFAVGGTVTVDMTKTAQNVMNSPSVTSDMYNAAMEKNMDVMWRCSNGPDKTGATVTWTAADAGKEYVCRVSFYSDSERKEFVDYIDGAPFVVSGGVTATIPTIATQPLMPGKVGQAYYQKLTCSDPDVKWSLFRSSLPEGMYLTQHGEIEGKPTKAGDYYVVVMATPEAGEDYAATAEFELRIAEADGQLYTIEILETPKKLVYTAGEKLDMKGLKVRIYGPDGYLDSEDGQHLTYSDKALVTLGEQKIALQYEDAFETFIVTVKAAPGGSTDATTEPTTNTTTEPTGSPAETLPEGTEPADPTEGTTQEGGNEPNESKDSGSVWLFVAIGLGVLTVGMGVAIVVILKKRKV